ncbi:MAG: hypothetical protein ACREAG_07620 [Nitrosopumilaceae archaeon]
MNILDPLKLDSNLKLDSCSNDLLVRLTEAIAKECSAPVISSSSMVTETLIGIAIVLIFVFYYIFSRIRKMNF